jgi:hypothetical protein
MQPFSSDICSVTALLSSNNTGQQIKKKVSVMNMLLIYLFASMKLDKGPKTLLGSRFKILLPLRYFTK